MAIPDFRESARPTRPMRPDRPSRSVVWNDMEFASIYRLVPKTELQASRKRAPDPAKNRFLPVGVDRRRYSDSKASTEIQRRHAHYAEVRIYAIMANEMVFGKRYEGPVSAARRMAHRIADDILLQAGNYRRGQSDESSPFSSDRRGERSKEIYIMDYDGYSQKPLTANRSLNLTPTWSPDGRTRRLHLVPDGNAPSLHLAHIYRRARRNLQDGRAAWRSTPSWSPDGTQHCVHVDARWKLGALPH